MGAPALAASAVGSVVTGLYDSYSYRDKARKMKNNFNNYLKDFDANVNNSVNDARKALSTTTASQIAQVSQGAAARGSQSGVSGANTEAIIAQASQPIYEAAIEKENNILNFLASSKQKRADMVYGFNTQKAQMDMNSPNPLGTALGVFQTGLNIYSGLQKAGVIGNKKEDKTKSEEKKSDLAVPTFDDYMNSVFN